MAMASLLPPESGPSVRPRCDIHLKSKSIAAAQCPHLGMLQIKPTRICLAAKKINDRTEATLAEQSGLVGVSKC